MSKLAVSLDLEMAQPSGRIIQIGAVIGDPATGNIVSRFSSHVNPQEQLSEFIINLTGITQLDVDRAPLLVDAYEQFNAWLTSFNKMRIINPITWGGGDTEQLRTEMGLEFGDDKWSLGRRWLDAKTLFTAWSMSRGKTPRAGLSKAMQALNLEFKGRAHDARVDAENTFAIWVELLKRFKTEV